METFEQIRRDYSSSGSGSGSGRRSRSNIYLKLVEVCIVLYLKHTN